MGKLAHLYCGVLKSRTPHNENFGNSVCAHMQTHSNSSRELVARKQIQPYLALHLAQ
ncbi:hypothetical protein EBME_1607 [bacterium endosymbiont of Mortierella elongata FMR23-6]|nr:hypothetical protein EBME_1607 [bacterium endosymbiont of Mortierella elongata FMR23-6]